MKNLAFLQKDFLQSLFFALDVAKRLNTRLASLPDLVNIRAHNGAENRVWNRWYTPASTIYFGVNDGKKLIVVAHHLGPLSTKERINKWSKSGTNDEGSDRRAYGIKGLPKITVAEFADLIAGKYGEVTLINFDEYRHGFLSHLRGEHILYSDALIDPLLSALFKEAKTDYLDTCLRISSEHAILNNKEEHAEKKILQLSLKDNYGWNTFTDDRSPFPEEMPVALFLTLGSAMHYLNNDLSVSTEIRGHEDLNSANFVVLNNVKQGMLNVGFNLSRDYKQCLVDNKEPVATFNVIMTEDNQMFVEYPKDGSRMDTGEAMFPVRNYTAFGQPTSFKTTHYGSPFLKYDINEVKAIAPIGANAYFICGDVVLGKMAEVPIQFCQITYDSSKRILRRQEVANNLPLLLKLNGVDGKDLAEAQKTENEPQKTT